MHISLTPELEKIIHEKVSSGLYNNASEVVREALRFMESHHELIYQMKLDLLRAKLLNAEHDLEEGRYTELTREEIAPFLKKIRDKVTDRIDPHSL